MHTHSLYVQDNKKPLWVIIKTQLALYCLLCNQAELRVRMVNNSTRHARSSAWQASAYSYYFAGTAPIWLANTRGKMLGVPTKQVLPRMPTNQMSVTCARVASTEVYACHRGKNWILPQWNLIFYHLGYWFLLLWKLIFYHRGNWFPPTQKLIFTTMAIDFYYHWNLVYTRGIVWFFFFCRGNLFKWIKMEIQKV